MNGTIVTPTPHISRDRYGRPLVTPPQGGKPVPYTRCTTFVSSIEDTFNLNRWEKRMVALGLASRPDLLLSVSAHRDDKDTLNRICDDAKEAAKGSAAATTGTALHALTELIDRGQELPPGLPANVTASLEAYVDATKDLKATHIEQFCVLDPITYGPPETRFPGIGGTPDRVVRYKGDTYIADLKTGSIEWGALKIAAQLAVYSRSSTYDIATGERGIHGASTVRGIVISLPSVQDPADAKCDLLWVDLLAGWEAVKVCKAVREKRELRFNDVMEPLGPTLAEALEASVAMIPMIQRIQMCKTAERVRALWTPDWTDDLIEVAKARVAELEQAS